MELQCMDHYGTNTDIPWQNRLNINEWSNILKLKTKTKNITIFKCSQMDKSNQINNNKYVTLIFYDYKYHLLGGFLMLVNGSFTVRIWTFQMNEKFGFNKSTFPFIFILFHYKSYHLSFISSIKFYIHSFTI